MMLAEELENGNRETASRQVNPPLRVQLRRECRQLFRVLKNGVKSTNKSGVNRKLGLSLLHQSFEFCFSQLGGYSYIVARNCISFTGKRTAAFEAQLAAGAPKKPFAAAPTDRFVFPRVVSDSRKVRSEPFPLLGDVVMTRRILDGETVGACVTACALDFVSKYQFRRCSEKGVWLFGLRDSVYVSPPELHCVARGLSVCVHESVLRGEGFYTSCALTAASVPTPVPSSTDPVEEAKPLTESKARLTLRLGDAASNSPLTKELERMILNLRLESGFEDEIVITTLPFKRVECVLADLAKAKVKNT
jgi:hypothetical protein